MKARAWGRQPYVYVLRDEHGIVLKEFCQLRDVNYAHAVNVSCGRVKPSRKLVNALLAHTGVEPEQLFSPQVIDLIRSWNGEGAEPNGPAPHTRTHDASKVVDLDNSSSGAHSTVENDHVHDLGGA
jgi:hypothetical protein